VGDIGQPPPRQWRTGAWESLVAAETASHFPRQQLANLGSVYQLLARMEGLAQSNLVAWNDLYPMIGPGRRLDTGSEAELRKAVSFARAVNRNYASLSITLIFRTQAMGLPFSTDDLQQIAAAKRAPLTAMRPDAANPDSTSAICSPIGAVPPRYGQSQFGLTPALAEKTVKTLPDFGAP
jgi:hypothetical protein